jgi:predicted trehalose synthase
MESYKKFVQNSKEARISVDQERSNLLKLRQEILQALDQARIDLASLKTQHARQRLEMKEKEAEAAQEIKSLGAELTACHTALGQFK